MKISGCPKVEISCERNETKMCSPYCMFAHLGRFSTVIWCNLYYHSIDMFRCDQCMNDFRIEDTNNENETEEKLMDEV